MSSARRSSGPRRSAAEAGGRRGSASGGGGGGAGRRGSVGSRASDGSGRKGSVASAAGSADEGQESGKRNARTNLGKVAGRAEIMATLKKKGVNVKNKDLDTITKVLQQANAKEIEQTKELAALNEQNRAQEAQIEFLTMQLEGPRPTLTRA